MLQGLTSARLRARPPRNSLRMARLPHRKPLLFARPAPRAPPSSRATNSQRARRASPTPAVRARACAPQESPALLLHAVVRAASLSLLLHHALRRPRVPPTPRRPAAPAPRQRCRSSPSLSRSGLAPRSSSGSPRHPPSTPLGLLPTAAGAAPGAP
jgi:hypothetical protein